MKSLNGCGTLSTSAGEKGQMFDVKIGVRQGDVWSPILFDLVINYVLANSVQAGIDIGRCVADMISPMMLPYWASRIPKFKQIYTELNLQPRLFA